MGSRRAAIPSLPHATDEEPKFRQFREIISSAGIHDYLVIAYRAVARMHDLRGEAREALAILDEAEQLAYNGQWPRAVRLIGWERVRRELLAGRLDRAQIIAGRIEEDGCSPGSDWVRISEDADDTVTGRIRLNIHAGKPRDALHMIHVCLRQATLRSRVHRQIKLHALAALAYKALGNDNLTHRSIERALHLAAPGGYMRAVLDEGEGISRLLLEHLKLRANANDSGTSNRTYLFLARLIGSSNPDVQLPPAGHGERAGNVSASAIEPFTEREKKILSMIVNYMSNEQIGTAMFVGRDTVKYHVKNIYGKLGVRSRLEAIRLVREKGML